jgi:hypothetical protein
MSSTQTTDLAKLGATIHNIILKASEENKVRILKSCQNATMDMQRDILRYYYAASGLHVRTHNLISGYVPLFDAHAVGNDTYIRAGIKNEVATSGGVNYAVVQEYGCGPFTIKPIIKKALWWKGAEHPVSEVHHPGLKARKVATAAVKHQGQVLVNKLLQEISF